MKIETKFRIAAAVIFFVMAFMAAPPIKTNNAAHAVRLALRTSIDNELQLSRMLDLLRDAETGQRGFIITGKESFLKPYYAAMGEIPLLRTALLASGTERPEQRKTLQAIVRTSDLMLAELAETINIRRTHGFAQAEAVVSTERGKQYMDILRDRIGQQVRMETRRRLVLQAELDNVMQDDLYLGIGATVVDMALLTALLIFMFRLLRERAATASALNKSAEDLAVSAGAIEQRNQQMELSAEMLQALGTLSSLEETAAIIATYGTKLLPGVAGVLYLYRNSRDLLEVQTSWGTPSSYPPHLEQTDCWSLKRGQPHHTHGAGDLPCQHYAAAMQHALGRLCVPLVAQGEVIGLIYLEGLSDEKQVFDAQYRVALRTAEQIALALSNVKLRETLRRQSIVDPLTGLFNRRYMDETLRRELIRAKRRDAPLSLIMLDLDHFKRINDTFGHDAGDVALKSVAQIVRNHVRESDLACRFGGEEILLILPECDQQAALERAEKIRAAVAALDVHHGGRTLGTITTSLGVAVFPHHGADAVALVHSVDQALYHAKNAGRNRVVLANA
jgi:diguanylate cyclase (GGDEF)-like protein